MPIHNADIAALFDEVADLLEIKGENPFRVRAYRNAARTMEELGTEVSTLMAQDVELTRLPGIGEDLAHKIMAIVETGRCEILEELRHGLPPGITELLKLPGLGPKRVKLLMDQLHITCIDDLRRAAEAGQIQDLRGFGPKTEQQILAACGAPAAQGQRVKLAVAGQYADALLRYLEDTPGVRQAVVAGSYRRAKETVGDLDIVVTAARGNQVMQRFVEYDEVAKVLAHGTTRATVVLRCGIQVDVRVVSQRSFGAALHCFTGSKAHNVAIRRLGQRRGLKINEYGVFRDEVCIAGKTETSVFQSVGLPYIVPELREDRGEIEAAQQGRLPKLMQLEDLRGDLHAHTKATDGCNTLAEMAEAARDRGLEYLAITEHSRHLAVAKGFDSKRLRRQMTEIDRLNTKLQGVTLLKGIEVDVLENGKLDLPDDVLSELDIVVAAVHSQFKLDREKQTARILARASPRAHPRASERPSDRRARGL